MLKKMMLLAVSVGALVAFAVPAVAQAQKLYETEAGTGNHIDLAVGADVTATSTDLVTHTKKGTLECEKVIIHGVVFENKANKSRIGNTSTTVIGCNTPITGPTVGEITFQGKEAGMAANVTFNGVGCHYAGNIPFSYVTNNDILHVTGTEQLIGTPASECGNATMTGTLTLETEDETPIRVT